MLMAEFATACRYRLPIKVVINNNSSLGQILWEQMVLGYPEYGVRFEREPDFAPWAEACGGSGIRVDKSDEVEAAISRSLRAIQGPRSSTSPSIRTSRRCPAKVQYEQAKGFVKSFLAGQPAAGPPSPAPCSGTSSELGHERPQTAPEHEAQPAQPH